MPTVTEPISSFHKYLSSFHVRGITLDARYTAVDKKDQVSVELSLHSTHKLVEVLWRKIKQGYIWRGLQFKIQA